MNRFKHRPPSKRRNPKSVQQRARRNADLACRKQWTTFSPGPNWERAFSPSPRYSDGLRCDSCPPGSGCDSCPPRSGCDSCPPRSGCGCPPPSGCTSSGTSSSRNEHSWRYKQPQAEEPTLLEQLESLLEPPAPVLTESEIRDVWELYQIFCVQRGPQLYY